MRDTTDHAAATEKLTSQIMVEFGLLPAGHHDRVTAKLIAIDDHTDALAARVDRLQRLWQAWQRAQGYAPDSRRWAALADALKACEDAGDLLPLEAME